MKYEKLFEPIKIGQHLVKNRIISGPVHDYMVAPDGHATGACIEHYKYKARGGAGIVTVGECAVDGKYAITHHHELALDREEVLPSLFNIAEGIKMYGAKASIELNHAGYFAHAELNSAKVALTPSINAEFSSGNVGFDQILKAGTPIEMTEELIEEAIESFAQAAFNVKTTGFDLIFLHGAHGWLLGQFFSPLINKRTDQYGGSLENRARFPLRVLERIREKCGPELGIEYRLSATEHVDGGITVEDTLEFAKMIQDKVDLIHVSCGSVASWNSLIYTHLPSYIPRGNNVYLAEAVKAAVDIPVTTIGAIVDPEMAEEILQEGRADMIAMSRGILADPQFPNKARTGRRMEITPCVRCLECLNRMMFWLPLRCAVNPVLGREQQFANLQPPAEKKKIMVIGGGPAGMQAAITASSLGHSVTLYEKQGRLGGALNPATVPSFKSDLKRYLDHLIYMVNQSPVQVKLFAEGSKEAVKKENPDVVIIAAGADPLIPDIPGITHPSVVWAGDVLTGTKKTGEKVIVAGGGHIGCETAVFLAEQGKSVTLIEMQDEVGFDAEMLGRAVLIRMLEENNVVVRTKEKITDISDKGVTVADRSGDTCTIDCQLDVDSIVLALGMTPRINIVDELKDISPEVYVIGDCRSPKNVGKAVHDGFNTAITI